VAVAVAAPASAGTRAPSVAAETYNIPASGTIAVEGHGFGHGHGLSQWGAQGAASHGVPASTILSTYYPGTASTTIAPRILRVWITADDGRDLQVAAVTGLTVTDAATGNGMTLPTGPKRWRVVPDGSGEHLESLTGSTWSRVSIVGAPVSAGPISFARAGNTGNTVPVVLPDGSTREYRGSVAAPRSGSGVRTVDNILIDDYLLSVVPSEAIPSWAPAALQAQAVAARTYAVYEKDHAPAGSTYDICDTSACQVFSGTRVRYANGSVREYEYASTTAAVKATAGQCRTYNHWAAFTQFSASNGGWTTDGGQPYLQANADPWDGWTPNYAHSWTATLSAAQLQAAFPSLGTVKALTVTARDGHGDWGGRVQTVVLTGVKNGQPTSVTTTGEGIHWAHSGPGDGGLLSNWWHIVGAPVSPTPAPSPTQPATPTPTPTMTTPAWFHGAWGAKRVDTPTASASTSPSSMPSRPARFGVRR
jgi:SpoIID/LytB domain protein